MNRIYLTYYIFISIICISCSSQFNKGVTNKNELRGRKPPSVKIKEEFDRNNKKAGRGNKKLMNKDGKSLDRALNKKKYKKLKKDKRYLKKKRKQKKQKK